MIRQFISRRRKGAMAMVALAGLVPVTGMMSANLNTSQMIDDRRQVQDAADALATMHGTWSARALNIISMNNVTSAQLLSVAVGSEALFLTTTELTTFGGLAIGHITAHGAQHCPPRTSGLAAAVEAVFWTAPCTAWHTGVSVPASLAIARAADINSDFNPLHGIRTAEKALAAIDGMNKALATRHPRAMAEISVDYYSLLDLDNHHFADPCIGPELRGQCDRTNSNDGMSLPIEEAGFDARAQLVANMYGGLTSTFSERGFSLGGGPILRGGSSRRRKLEDHINNITQIGNALYEFRRFYTSRISDLPRHPFAGPGSAIGPRPSPPGEPPDDETPFDDDTTDFLDGLKDLLEDVDDVTQQVLRVLRNIPLAYDRHPSWANLPPPQRRRGQNSFHRNFGIMIGLIMTPDIRKSFPLGLDLNRFELVTAVPVPETFQLSGINPNPITNPLPPFEARSMPESFHVLAYGLKEKSKRLGEAVMTSPVTTHTGYGQAGVFNPDGATLFTQNWVSELMPATRLDAVRNAANDLARQAPADFDDLAEQLQQVQSYSSWGQVNAH